MIIFPRQTHHGAQRTYRRNYVPMYNYTTLKEIYVKHVLYRTHITTDHDISLEFKEPWQGKILATLTLFSFEMLLLIVRLLIVLVCAYPRPPGSHMRNKRAHKDKDLHSTPLESLILAFEKAWLGNSLEPRRISRRHMSWLQTMNKLQFIVIVKIELLRSSKMYNVVLVSSCWCWCFFRVLQPVTPVSSGLERHYKGCVSMLHIVPLTTAQSASQAHTDTCELMHYKSAYNQHSHITYSQVPTLWCVSLSTRYMNKRYYYCYN